MAPPMIVAPAYEIDTATVEEFRLALAGAVEEGADSVIVDLSDVGFIDSTGLGAVLRTHSQLQRADRRLAVVAPRGSAAAVVLTLAGLRTELRVHESRAAALDSH